MTSHAVEERPPVIGHDRTTWRRHPSDVLRLLINGALLLIALAVVAAAPEALRNVSADLVRLVGRLPSLLRDFLVGISQLAVLVAPLVLIGWAARWRRGRELLLAVAAGLLAALVMASLIGWLDRVAPPTLLRLGPDDAWLADRQFPSASYLAGLSSIVTVLAPSLTRPWRRAAWASVAVAAVIRVLTAAQVPVNIAVAVLLGAVVGSTLLVAVGAPVRRPGRERVEHTATALRVELTDVIEDDATHGLHRAWRATSADGRHLRLVYLGTDERDADLLYRWFRRLWVRGIEDTAPGISARRLAEREALMTLLAAANGVRVPAVLGVDEADDGSAVIAFEHLDGAPLDAVPPSELDDDTLRAVWAQVDRLHRHGLAHRRLKASRVLLTAEGPALRGLRWGETAATPPQRAADVAELLASTALLVGPDRAVAAAVAELDHDEAVRALAYLQPLALTDDTRQGVRRRKGLLDDLRNRMQDAVGEAAPPLEPLRRITVTGVVTGVGLFVLAGFVLGLAANWGEIVESLRNADWAYLPWMLLLMVLTFVAGALSLQGSVLRALGTIETTIVMFGQSFLNRFTPANAGGMAMRIRYLQKGGTDLAVATAAIGLTSAASGAMQVVMIIVFFTWGGSTPGGGSTGNVDGTIVSLVVLLVVAVVAVVWLVPAWRSTVLGWVRQTWTKVRTDFGELARQPTKLLLLFGGAGLSKLLTICAFVLACRSFGIDLGFPELGALYLGANTVASAVPTPGGVGAIEAALVFVLTGAGVGQPEAWSAVLLFRLVTYWLPIVPGWFALDYCKRTELV